jgi:hypothetical protein
VHKTTDTDDTGLRSSYLYQISSGRESEGGNKIDGACNKHERDQKSIKIYLGKLRLRHT